MEKRKVRGPWCWLKIREVNDTERAKGRGAGGKRVNTPKKEGESNYWPIGPKNRE